MRAGNGSVYVWHESSCPPARVEAAMEMARKYLEARNRRLGLASDARVEVVKEGSETPFFTRCFCPWHLQ